MSRRFLACASALAALIPLAGAPLARGASKVTIAAQGDVAPGVGGPEGRFAGPSFVGEASTAGDGWIAFRSQITEGDSAEQIEVWQPSTRQRDVVAFVGQTISESIGSVRQFLGRPTVNARGDVAFAAVINPPDDAPAPDPLAPLPPTPAGIFLWSQGQISAVVEPGYDSGYGILDLTTPINLFTLESGIDIAERTPALNDAGDVAFVSATLDRTVQKGALFVRRAGQAVTAVVKLGDAYDNGTFEIIGPPALNNVGTIAFRGFVEGREELLDGVFTLSGGALSLLIRDGETPATLPVEFTIDPLAEFGDVVAINDAGDVACTAGPIYDNGENSGVGDPDGSPGAIVIRAGARPLVVGFPGLPVETFGARPERIYDLTLGPEEASRTAPPSLTPDSQVVFLARLGSGSSQAILRADPVAGTVRLLVSLGGRQPDASPRGGTYLDASSAPAADAVGGIVFSARVEGTTTSEVLTWRPATGDPEGLTIGDAAATGDGFYGGDAFFPPLINDAGDIVFKSYVTRGPALGIFRYRQGALSPVVRIQDLAPLEPAEGGQPPRFTNLLGEPSLNKWGDVAFAATVEGRGRGIFVSQGGVLQKVAMTFDDLDPADPDRPGAYIRTIAAGPSLSDSGAVVFRGIVQFEDDLGILFPDVKQSCIFLADTSGVRVLVAQDDDTDTGVRFVRFRDPSISGNSVLFRAEVDFPFGKAGLYLHDGTAVRTLAFEGQEMSGATLTTLQGKGLFDQAGNVFVSARLQERPDENPYGVLLRGGPSGLQPVLETGTSGPEGGRIRSLGRPSVAPDGRVALRLGFDPFTGGVSGVFLAGDGPPSSFLRIGENASARLKGRITSLNQNVAINADDRVAFLATIGGGDARSAILLGAPTKVVVKDLRFQRGKRTLADSASFKPRDRVQFTADLEPGLLPDDTTAANEKDVRRIRAKTVTVAVADTQGTLWSGTVAATDTRLRGRTLTKKRRAASRIGALRVRFTRTGMRIKARSIKVNLADGGSPSRTFDEVGAPILAPDFSVRVDVGEDGGSAIVPCAPKGRNFRCGG